MKKFFLTLIIILTFFPSLNASKLSPFTRSILLEKQRELKPKSLENSSDEKKVSGFLYLKTPEDTCVLRDLDVKINSAFDTIFTVEIPVSRLEELENLEQVSRFEISTPLDDKMNRARTFGNVNSVFRGDEPIFQSFTGRGVVVGIIDAGFQYDHTNFMNKERTQTRIERVWEQTRAATPHPTGFNYGRELRTKAEILAAKSDGVSSVHGTHVAGIAAGNSEIYGGVAPDATLILVSTNYEISGVVDAIKYIFDNAGSRSCVVNISLGTHLGPHDGSSTFDKLCAALVGEKKIVVGAAGNEGRYKIHISKNFNNKNDTLKTLIKPFGKTFSAPIDIWGAKGEDFTVQPFIYKKGAGVVKLFNKINGRGNVSNTLNVPSQFGNGYIDFAAEINPRNDKGNVVLRKNGNFALFNGYFFGVKIAGAGEIHAWINGEEEFVSEGVPEFSNGDGNCTVTEIGGVPDAVISVGSFDSSTDTSLGIYENSVSYFTSRGPTADGRLKPDVLAPGAVITSSANGYARSVSGYAARESFGGRDFYYGTSLGTSMASPFVAGAIALWFEAARFLSPSKVRDIFSLSCDSDFRTGKTPNPLAGYGKINAFEGMIQALLFSSLPTVAAENSDVVFAQNPSAQEFSLTFKNEKNDVKIEVFDVLGKILIYKNFAKISAETEEKFNVSAFPIGVYFVKISNENKIFKFIKN